MVGSTFLCVWKADIVKLNVANQEESWFGNNEVENSPRTSVVPAALVCCHGEISAKDSRWDRIMKRVVLWELTAQSNPFSSSRLLLQPFLAARGADAASDSGVR